MAMRTGPLFALGAAVLLAACDSPPPPSTATAEWAPPAESEIPNDSLGAAIRRGLNLIRYTPDSLPKYATSNLRCVSCHQGDGRKLEAAPLIGSHARYPKYLPRTGAVVTIHDRVNYCFTRSLAGNALPYDSREMADIVAYLAFLSKGAPMGGKTPGADGLIAMKDTLVGNSERGKALFTAKRCATCHGADGTPSVPGIPSLWGPASYAIGASMARLERAASFISHNMPQDAPGSLTAQEAFDLAAYVNAQPRPDSPGKENDYPNGGAPRDVPYATKGRQATTAAVRLLPRANPAGATVPAPPSVFRRSP
jgi:thiosulfate dehydrogenase